MTKSILNIAAAAVISVMITVVPKAQAQDAPIMALDPTLMAGWTGNLAAAESVKAHSSATAKTNFAYTSTPALRQQVVTSFARRLQSQNAQGVKALVTAFGPGKEDYDQIYKQMLKTSALHNNDAADALAGLLVVGYQLVNGLKDKDVTPVMERGARTQVAAILAKNPKMTSATTRAQVSEELKLQTVLIVLGYMDTQKATSQSQAAYKQSIASMFKSQYRLDMANLKLTARGFTKK